MQYFRPCQCWHFSVPCLKTSDLYIMHNSDSHVSEVSSWKVRFHRVHHLKNAPLYLVQCSLTIVHKMYHAAMHICAYLRVQWILTFLAWMPLPSPEQKGLPPKERCSMNSSQLKCGFPHFMSIGFPSIEMSIEIRFLTLLDGSHHNTRLY